MSIQTNQYEEALADYSNALAAIALLRQYRPYLETIPSMRRPDESVITIPYPIVQTQAAIAATSSGLSHSTKQAQKLPCDVAILMCDPEWKVKTGVEILIFLHRPQEDFSDLLGRWRQTQVCLSHGYQWDMPFRYRHILSEGADIIHPLFVLFEDTPERIRRGLKGAFLPFVTRRTVEQMAEEAAPPEPNPTEALWMDNEDTLQ